VPTSNSSDEIVDLRTSEDVLRARQRSRVVAEGIGFESADQTRISTAVSEIARNVLQHSGTTGTVRLGEFREGGKLGLAIVVHDSGCGIASLELVLGDDESSLVLRRGAGLPGSKRLMDEFKVETGVGRGTTVNMVKWLRRAEDVGA
jgi:serine/threonine-protein kinase RsbT